MRVQRFSVESKPSVTTIVGHAIAFLTVLKDADEALLPDDVIEARDRFAMVVSEHANVWWEEQPDTDDDELDIEFGPE